MKTTHTMAYGALCSDGWLNSLMTRLVFNTTVLSSDVVEHSANIRSHAIQIFIQLSDGLRS